MEFQQAYDAFIKFHRETGSEQKVQRIQQGLNYAEKMFVENVWWPAFQNFNGLHPEYEVRDFKDGNRYIDFAYIQPNFRIAIEIDGFGAHWRDITQEQFADHILRQNHLVIDGWYVLRFVYRDVHEHPRLCQQTIQQLVGRLSGNSSGVLRTIKVLDREILRLVVDTARPITAQDVASRFALGRRAATRHLKKLVEEDWLEPASGSLRIRSYRIHHSRADIQL